MGCRNLEQEDRILPSSSPVNDGLLLTTMRLIGLSVDVHIKDGSVYSGIFHTACVDDYYAVVLKQAKMMKKGSCNSNVANEDVIGTLVIQSQDLVQVVAKKVVIPAAGFSGHEAGDDTGADACSFPSNGIPLTDSNKLTSKSNGDQPHTNQSRCSSRTENGYTNGFTPKSIIHTANALEVKSSDTKGSTKKEECMNDLNGNRINGSRTSSSESLITISAPSETVTTKILTSNPTVKEFKLNPGANSFSPSFPNKRSPTPPTIATGVNLAYIPDSYPGVLVSRPQPKVDISPFASHSLPVKYVPYGGNNVQHPPPVVGYMTNRSQPVRYSVPYHPVQTTPTYVQPSSQNVMVGRLGPVVYVHPVSQDMVPSTNSFSSLTPHQLHVPKHQGTTAAQALQLCVAPPFIGGVGQPPFVLPSHIPVSQPLYPVMRPISVPGSNGFLVSKFS